MVQKGWRAFALAMTMAAVPVQAHAATLTSDAPLACTDGASGAFAQAVRIDGEATRAAVALPAEAPKAIVVLAHGYPGVYPVGDPFVDHELDVRARENQAVVVVPEYRGTTATDEAYVRRGAPVRKGGEDLAAFARAYAAACGQSLPRVLLSQSFGAVTGAHALSTEPAGTFDAWFGEGGLYDLAALAAVYLPLGTAGVDGGITEDLAAEFGGTFAEKPDAYVAASPYSRAATIGASGVQYFEMHHGGGEYVPVEFATRMRAAMATTTVPTTLVVHATGRSQSCPEYEGTAFEEPYNGEMPGGAPSGPLAAHLGDATHCPLWDGIERWLDRRAATPCETTITEQYLTQLALVAPTGCAGARLLSVAAGPRGVRRR